MANIGWILAWFFWLVWLCTEYERRQLKKLTLIYEQRLRSNLVGYDTLWSKLYGPIDHRLAVAKAQAILKNSEQHKLTTLKLVDNE